MVSAQIAKIVSAAMTLTALVVSQVAWANTAAAHRAIAKGDFEKAVKEFKKSKNPEAPYYIGRLALIGKVPDCDQNCALDWFRKAVDRDYVPALPQIAMLYWNDGQKDVGYAVLEFAARWNDPNSIELLHEMDRPVPVPDLWNNRVAEVSALQERQQQQTAKANEAIGFALGAFLSGYYGSRTVSRAYTPVEGAPKAVVPIATFPPSTHMCPDGTYIYGDRCHMAVDGSFVGGQPHMAPDGSYVAGRPRLAPDGSYVGGQGRTKLCPDGSYVAGSRCKLMPDGTYAGVP